MASTQEASVQLRPQTNHRRCHWQSQHNSYYRCKEEKWK